MRLFFLGLFLLGLPRLLLAQAPPSQVYVEYYCVKEVASQFDEQLYRDMEFLSDVSVTAAVAFSKGPQLPDPCGHAVNPVSDFSVEKATQSTTQSSELLYLATMAATIRSPAFVRSVKACVERRFRSIEKALGAADGVYRKRAIDGYSTQATFDDPKTGFKAIVQRPEKEITRAPVIFAVAGTEDAKDWKADLMLGKTQFEAHHRKILELAEEHIRQGHQILFTGHSLGGGLAQAMAYELSRKISAKAKGGVSSEQNMIQCVTWNGFGSEQLLKAAGIPTPENEHRLRYQGMNFRTNHDPVSLIGRQLGEQFTLPTTRSFAGDWVGEHGISTVIRDGTHGGAGKLSQADSLNESKIQKLFHAWITGAAGLSLMFK